ncbi:MAG: sulfatase-like hydrolase/transferase [Cyclobacteriaceae bacterium]
MTKSNAFTLFFILLGVLSCKQQQQPNILWIVTEDISPYLGSYGCKEAQTPNLDKLAENGIRFTHAYANSPVCAIARSTLLTGMYATTTGTNNMRVRQVIPHEIPVYSKILMKNGYYCTNNAKTDYNSHLEFEKNNLWDETSKKAHWKNRPEGKPFFSIFNIGTTHEGQLIEERIKGYIDRGEIPSKTRTNPEDIELPPYQPDLPEVRQDWARLHDLVTRMDETAGMRLQELEDEGVADNTIVFFYSDHGGQLARSKRFVYNSGTRVPFIVYLPDKWKHLSDVRKGETYKDLVSFVDFPKTLVSIAGCDVPELMQGHVFLGGNKEESPDHVHLYRDRMDEQPGFSRATTDGKYHFIRNFLPHVPDGSALHFPYTVQANWRAFEQHFRDGQCDEIQSRFFSSKPTLQLFDLENDKWEINNLVSEPEHQERLKRMSQKLDQWMIDTRDIGLIPEAMYFDLIGNEKKYKTLYEYAQSSEYDIERILEVAKAASLGEIKRMSEYVSYMKDKNPIVRYWGAYGAFLTKKKDKKAIATLKKILKSDDKVVNRLMAAQYLGIIEESNLAFKAILKDVEATDDGSVFHAAIMAFYYSHTDHLLSKGDLLRFSKKAFPRDIGIDQTAAHYTKRVLDKALNMWPERITMD